MKKPLFSAAILLSVLLFSFLTPLILHVDATALDKHSILLAPSLTFPFGTDRLGRDLFSRIIEGGQVSLIIGFASALIASFVGFIIGATAGFMRGKVDKSVVIIIDLFLTFPTFFLLLALVSYVNASIWVLVIIISITGWMSTARLIRSEAFKITTQPYIKILNIAKVNQFKILTKYYAPLLAPIFLVSFTFGVGGAILAESGLSYLGLGIVAPQMSWGSILSTAKEVNDIAWWVGFFPGLMIFLVTFSLLNIANYFQSVATKNR